MSTSFTALSADEVYADIKSFLDVLGMPDHVHDENSSFVEFVHCPLWRNTDGGDEKFGLFVNDNVEELRELSVGVVGLYISDK